MGVEMRRASLPEELLREKIEGVGMVMGKKAEVQEAAKVKVARTCWMMATGIKEMDGWPEERKCR